MSEGVSLKVGREGDRREGGRDGEEGLREATHFLLGVNQLG